MLSIPRLLPAALPALALPCLVSLAGLTATAPFAGIAAQEAAQPAAAAPEVGQERRGRRGRRRERASRNPAVPPGMQQSAPLATFGDWNVFTGVQDKARVCYAIAQPQSRSPKSLARDTAYLFVTVPKGRNTQNEIAVMFGFKPKLAASQSKPGAAAAPSDPYLTVGGIRYGLVVKDENAWVLNQAEEPRIVAEMSRNATATVRTTSLRGNPTSDDYALGGFADAVKRARDECK